MVIRRLKWYETRNAFLLCFLLSSLVPGCHTPRQAETQATVTTAALEPLNVVVVTIDTLRADRLGCYGYSSIETPELDHLARLGVVFDNAVAAAPLTLPSHASMFTGVYPTVHGVRNSGGFALDRSQQTLARLLQQQGWQTGAFVGSAVLDRVYGLNEGFQTYDDQMPNSTFDTQSTEDPSRSAGMVVDRAIAWLERQAEPNPFFLWVHVYDPHAPYQPPSPFKEKYRGRLYDGEVAYADRELGRLFKALWRKSPREKTVMAVLSDHGESLSEHGEYYHGVFLYESTLRIPWIMLGPGIPAGQRILDQVRTIDLLPTLLGLLGGKLPAACQGVNLSPAFSGLAVETTYSYAETLFPKINMGWTELRAIRTPRWKYIRAPRSELYDLEKDPSETVNLIHLCPSVAQELELKLQQLTSTRTGLPAETLELRTISEATENELQSLGYVSAGKPRGITLTGQGIDPKDRLNVLRILEECTSRQKPVSLRRQIQRLSQALHEDSANPAIYLLLAQAYEWNQQTGKALEIYQSAIQKRVTATSRMYARMGVIYGQMGRIDEAVDAFENALDIDSTDLDSQEQLAQAYLLKGRLSDAERILRYLLGLNEENAQAHNNLGWVDWKKKSLREARNHFERAIQLDPTLAQAYLNLGLFYKEAGNYEEARNCFENFLVKAAPAENKNTVEKVKKELSCLKRLHQGWSYPAK